MLDEFFLSHLPKEFVQNEDDKNFEITENNIKRKIKASQAQTNAKKKAQSHVLGFEEEARSTSALVSLKANGLPPIKNKGKTALELTETNKNVAHNLLEQKYEDDLHKKKSVVHKLDKQLEGQGNGNTMTHLRRGSSKRNSQILPVDRQQNEQSLSKFKRVSQAGITDGTEFENRIATNDNTNRRLNGQGTQDVEDHDDEGGNGVIVKRGDEVWDVEDLNE